MAETFEGGRLTNFTTVGDCSTKTSWLAGCSFSREGFLQGVCQKRQPEASHTQNLLQLHDAGVGANVVDGVGLLGLFDVLVLEDIVERQGLLRKGSHCVLLQRRNEKNHRQKEEVCIQNEDEERG